MSAENELELLRGRLEASAAEIVALNNEIDETNRGVLALYAELDDRATQLREVSELKGRFLYYMSHEFRTPLGSILSVARLLSDEVDGRLSGEQQRQVGFIRNAARELSEMVDDLLDLAKVEAGRVTISPAWFDLVDIFSALRGMFKPILGNFEVSLIMEDPVDVPRVYTDDKRLSQILRNFVSNALKFTQRGEVRVTAVRDGDHVVFAVSDTGIGIAREHQHALFQDFVQVDSPIQKRLRGTGLGLSLSKRLAELLGGTVAVDSELGRGSTFSVRIPIHYDKLAAVEPPAEGTRP